MSWWKDLRGKIRLNEPLKKHTTFKVGGRAKFFIEPRDIEGLKSAFNLLKRHKVPFLIIGAGSNILASDKGLDHAVICLNAPCFKRLFFNGDYLQAGSAAMLKQVVLQAQRHGLSGSEFLGGIPGTIGGALVMNAGIPEARIADLIKDVTVLDGQGKIKILNKKNIEFGYRRSGLSKYIILHARLKLFKKNKQQIKDKTDRYLNYRRLTQDLSLPSAGCAFKNPRGRSAGRLIDLCGLKGTRIGGASISLRHANFILNFKNASAKDILRLMGLIKKRVKAKFNITLEPEIKIWQ
ncbi:MAG: UDP-N-acetylmuramate dehydrogenase [Candidatus Omnitrophica bacterium]|nr:UDP-N-acetylmuramate dehydrogenase [Candidatus Omnitrophota bacterium]MBU4473580.1 UDP-N-acetylmuramate dehydrogenase [Candidatus Omnitrophota bacterium]MCG2706297.1 UDP-N-acetylmuramate dehydrogenase [Candidatus Omnitrophota bacterium]